MGYFDVYVFCGQNKMQMNYLIVEKKFISSSSSQKLHTFRQMKDKMSSMPSYSTIFYDRENTQSIQSQLKNTCSKPSFQLAANNNNFNKNEDSDALTYSRTGSLLMVEDLVPLLKRIVTLLSCKENIASHVSHSLGVRGYKSELSTEMGKIVANSFGEYINIAQSLSSKLNKEDFSDKEDRIMGLNRDIAALKMENAKLFEKNTKIQEDNHKLKKMISGLKESSKMQSMSQNHREQLMGNFQKDISSVMSRMNSFESQVYRKLGTYQHTLIDISNFRNSMAMNIANESRWRDECSKYKQRNSQLQRMLEIKQNTIQKYVLKENTSKNKPDEKSLELFKKIVQDQTQEIKRLQDEIASVTQQLAQQKKLYDQMLDKNISLQKELYFLSLKPGEEEPSDSLHIDDSPDEIGSFCDSGVGENFSARMCGGIGVCGSGGVM